MRKRVKKITIAVAIIVIVGLFLIFDLDRFLTLSYLKDSKDSFQTLYKEHQLYMIAIYMVMYIVVTSLSLPGATVMTLAGGVVFGLLVGTIVVSFASTIGATLACLAARFILSDWVQQRFEKRLVKVNREIEHQGAFYLFSIRLIPAFPFWVINLVMGLTKMPVSTFFWVSQIGMLPGTIVYVNAGNELAQINSLSGIISPGLILSFIILGIFPITVKKLMNLYKSRKNVDDTPTVD